MEFWPPEVNQIGRLPRLMALNKTPVEVGPKS